MRIRSSFDAAWNAIFDSSQDANFLEALKNLFPINDDYLEERQFSKLHQTVLGLTSHNLSAEVIISNAEINKVDIHGITPLMWAARRGDNQAVDILLKAGANPNLITRRSMSALLYAVQSSLTCVRLLLDAGADPTQKDDEDNNAMFYTDRYHDSKEMVERLNTAGVNLHGQDVRGGTPLVHMVIRDHVSSAEFLLDLGVDIDSCDNDGDTSLHESVRWHANNTLQLLLNRGANHMLLNISGDSVLHLAANNGNLRTLEILQAAYLKGIDPDLTNRQGKKPLQIAQERTTKEEGFVQKFVILLSEIRLRNVSDTTSEDLFADAPEQPPPTSSVPDPSNPTSSGFSNWTRPNATEPTTRNFRFTRVSEWWTRLQARLARPRWTSFMIYWVLGLGWAGCIYMFFFPRQIRLGEWEA